MEVLILIFFFFGVGRLFYFIVFCEDSDLLGNWFVFFKGIVIGFLVVFIYIIILVFLFCYSIVNRKEGRKRGFFY